MRAEFFSETTFDEAEHAERIDALSATVTAKTDTQQSSIDKLQADNEALKTTMNNLKTDQETMMTMMKTAHEDLMKTMQTMMKNNEDLKTQGNEPTTVSGNDTELEQELYEDQEEQDEEEDNLLKPGDGSARAQALGIRSLKDIDTATGARMGTERLRITRVQPLLDCITAKDKTLSTDIKALTKLKGILLMDAAAEMIKRFESDYDYNYDLAVTMMWAALSSADLSDIEGSAANVLKDFLSTADCDVPELYKRCAQGAAGIKEGSVIMQVDLSTSSTPGYRRLQGAKGWKQLLTATLKQQISVESVTITVKNEINKLEKTTQQDDTAATYIQRFEDQICRIARLCKLAKLMGRIPREASWMDLIEANAEADVRAKAVQILTEVDKVKRDGFTYDLMKTALISADGALHDQGLRGKKTEKTVTPKKTEPTKLTPEQHQITTELRAHKMCIYQVHGKCLKGSRCDFSHEPLETVGFDTLRVKKILGITTQEPKFLPLPPAVEKLPREGQKSFEAPTRPTVPCPALIIEPSVMAIEMLREELKRCEF